MTFTLIEPLSFGAATAVMRLGYVNGVDYRTWVGESDFGQMTYFDTAALSAMYSTNGQIAVAAATRTSDVVAGVPGVAAGVASFAVTDNPNPAVPGTWAYYGTSRRYPGANGALGAELTMGNLGNTVELNPYLTGATGTTAGLWLSSGSEAFSGGETVNPASGAIGIVSNGSTWARGLVIGFNALRPDGNGHTVAAILPTHSEIQWTFDGTLVRGGFIRTDATITGAGIIFNNTGFNVVDAATETTRFSVTPAGAVASSGGLTVGTNTAAGNGFATNGPAASGRYTAVQTAGSNRWVFGANSTAESGANAGSDFVIYNYSDAGAFIGTPLTINRASGTIYTENLSCASFAANGNAVSGKITISGSRGSATATVLESLLQAMQTFGLITDSTSA